MYCIVNERVVMSNANKVEWSFYQQNVNASFNVIKQIETNFTLQCESLLVVYIRDEIGNDSILWKNNQLLIYKKIIDKCMNSKFEFLRTFLKPDKNRLSLFREILLYFWNFYYAV